MWLLPRHPSIRKPILPPVHWLPSLSHCFRLFPSSHGISYLCYADETQLILSFLLSNNHSSTCLSACQAAHQPRLNPSRTELLYIPCDLPGKASDHTICQSTQTWCNSGQPTIVFFFLNIKSIWLFLSMEATPRCLFSPLLFWVLTSAAHSWSSPACFPSIATRPPKNAAAWEKNTWGHLSNLSCF